MASAGKPLMDISQKMGKKYHPTIKKKNLDGKTLKT